MRGIELSEIQLEAVNYNEGFLLVSAGPGSGKTRVIVEKILKIINDKNALEREIIAITFTNKASNEMKDRVRDRLEKENSSVEISTIHSFALKKLREYSNYIKNSIIDEEDVIDVYKEVLAKYSGEIYIEDLKEAIDEINIKRNNNTITELMGENLELYKLHMGYQEILRTRNIVDFDCILEDFLTLLETETILKTISSSYKYLLVDEFQDINIVQYEIIKKLGNQIGNLCLVGDLDQSIYLWRGANNRIIEKTLSDFKSIKIINLLENYRSSSDIVNFCNKIILKNDNPIRVSMKSVNSEKGVISIKNFNNKNDEVNWIIDLIKGGLLKNETAILFRANYQMLEYESLLKRYGINYNLSGGLSLYKRNIIKTILSYIKFAYNRNDYYSFVRSSSNPKRGLGEVASKSILIDFDSLGAYESTMKYLAKQSKKRVALENYFNLIDKINLEIDKKSFPDIVKIIIEETGIVKDVSDDENIIINIFLSSISEFDVVGRDKIKILVDNLFLDSELVNLTDHSVTLSTIHSAKGREFDNVFIPNLCEGNIPWYKSAGNPEMISEELRILYVGASRAKSKLFLSWHLFGNNDSVNRKSEFIDKIAYITLENKYEDMYEKYMIGGSIDHKIFGKGIIIRKSIEHGLFYIEVKFNEVGVGIKTLDISKSPIR
jgi:DNA helicase-2/ATP-dependent DNA helicase PcrA